MLKICLVFWKSEPQYAYKRYAYKKTYMFPLQNAKNGFHQTLKVVKYLEKASYSA